MTKANAVVTSVVTVLGTTLLLAPATAPAYATSPFPAGTAKATAALVSNAIHYFDKREWNHLYDLYDSSQAKVVSRKSFVSCEEEGESGLSQQITSYSPKFSTRSYYAPYKTSTKRLHVSLVEAEKLAITYGGKVHRSSVSDTYVSAYFGAKTTWKLTFSAQDSEDYNVC